MMSSEDDVFVKLQDDTDEFYNNLEWLRADNARLTVELEAAQARITELETVVSPLVILANLARVWEWPDDTPSALTLHADFDELANVDTSIPDLRGLLALLDKDTAEIRYHNGQVAGLQARIAALAVTDATGHKLIVVNKTARAALALAAQPAAPVDTAADDHD